jgi:hypothetical protein
MSDYVTAAEFAAKFKDKVELERFLKMDMEAHLPKHSTVSAFFYRSLLSEEKQVRDPNF